MKSDSHITLLIEDDRRAFLLLRDLIRAHGGSEFELHHESSLASGLAAISRGGVELILLDLTLPDSEGFETFQKVIEAAPRLPIIVITGMDDSEMALRSVHCGAQDFLVKGSLEGLLLVKAMRYAMERKQVQLALEEANQQMERRVEQRTAELREANSHLQLEISERKGAEDALRESKRLLEEALAEVKATQAKIIQRERLHALGNMATGIAHDFNNALAPILGFSDLLLLKDSNLEDRDKVRRYLEMIRSSAQDAAAVVGRLREFYREPDKRETREAVNLSDLASKALLLTKPRWRDQALADGINVIIETDMQRVPQITGNPQDLQDVFTNLILNAVESLEQNGMISIRIFSEEESVVAEVKDTGIGMSEEVLGRCIDPFFSTKGIEGSGFGLPKVHAILERHGGSMDIESSPGKGTLVRLRIPVSPSPSAVSGGLRSSRTGDPLSILVVDDEPLMREVIVACLSGDGHRVQTASDGVEALEVFGRGKFDLVITDRAMPRMNGDQLAKEIKAINPSMFVLLLTGFGQLMEAAGEHPEAIDLIVSKPFTIEGLRNAISQAVSTRPRP